MKLALKAMLGGVIIAAVAFAPAAANPSALATVKAENRSVQQSTSGPTSIAWTQKFIRIGPGRSTDRWRCSVNLNGTVYFSTGFIESSAREKLMTRTRKPPLCRRKDQEFFGFQFGNWNAAPGADAAEGAKG